MVLYNYPAVVSYSKETDRVGKTGRVVSCEDTREFRLDPLRRKVPSFPIRPAQAPDALPFHQSVTIDIKLGERKYPITREVPTPKLDRRRRLVSGRRACGLALRRCSC